MEEVTKAELIAIAETSDKLDYMGDIVIETETRKYYRVGLESTPTDRKYKIVYIVV